MDAARWIIVGVVVLMMCSTLGALYKLNKQVLYVYEDEAEKQPQPNIVVAPIDAPQNTLSVKRAGPMPSFAFTPVDEPDLVQQFKQGDERRRGLKELAQLASAADAIVPAKEEKK